MNRLLFLKFKYLILGVLSTSVVLNVYNGYLRPKKIFVVSLPERLGPGLVRHGRVFGRIDRTTTRWPAFDLKAVREDMLERRRRIKLTCEARNHSKEEPQPRAIVSIQREVLYCPVEKTASTFFRQLLYQLDNTNPLRSPFEVPVKLVYECPTALVYLKYLKQHRERFHKNHTLKTVMKQYTKLMFVRDPWSRLFSVYVDKLYSPNPFYWGFWGIKAIKKFRVDATQKALTCGNDVTFSEFLKFVLHLRSIDKNMDVHLNPMAELCKPCSVDYDVIGYTSTFNRDLMFLLSTLNLTNAQINFESFADDVVKQAVEDAVLNPFRDWTNKITACMTKLEAAKRIWRKLQIRSFISSEINFPANITEEIIQNMDAYDFIDILFEASRRSKSDVNLKHQKDNALTDAFKAVDMSIVEAIRNIYEFDFSLFGFESRPNSFFRDESGDLDVFNIAKPWKV
ncbi:uncharacterized protein LOC131942658 [Physella acuta]|uniref:uncharacterized protein LOC131942658 n=1 Tax=Physella acuta TaxID=109671 RepID=UPI0027DBEC9E|nr:uncharacterized protein LOC131942658 [Physella acuta]XP_059158540.1 uncharacterized protein LOC131942658 [Physella acuta]